MKSLSLIGFVVGVAALGTGAEGGKPNIVMILVDDYGWNDIGYHRAEQSEGKYDPEINTPNLDNLARSGIELNRHYTYNFCSPTRSSLQSGRLPVNVVVDNIDPLSYNPDDPVAGFSGIPPNMTGIATKLKEAGYRTHMTGKWDAGMSTWEQTPMGRGYETFFGYFHHANDYWDQSLSGGSTVHPDACAKKGLNLIDLWDTNGPAIKKNGTDWEEYMFTENTLKIIEKHDPSEPLFLFHSFHIVHTPLQVPEEHEKRFQFLKNVDRRKYASMVEYMDSSVGKFVSALQQKGMWENTLLVLSSDNGGPIYGSWISPTGPNRAFGAANNLPLRGGKTSDWEGGIRVNAFASGGAIPKKMRGKVLDDYIHISDWYSTFCDIAGVDHEDKVAQQFDLPPVDGISQWPLLSGETPMGSGPRTEIHVSRKTLIQGRWKLLTGNDRAIFSIFEEKYMTFDVHSVGWGPRAIKNTLTKGRNCEAGCLFDIHSDPNEDQELSDIHPDIVTKMMARLEELNKSNFNPDRGNQSTIGCDVAMNQYNGFYGPFLDASSFSHKGKQLHQDNQVTFTFQEIEFMNSEQGQMLAAMIRS